MSDASDAADDDIESPPASKTHSFAGGLVGTFRGVSPNEEHNSEGGGETATRTKERTNPAGTEADVVADTWAAASQEAYHQNGDLQYESDDQFVTQGGSDDLVPLAGGSLTIPGSYYSLLSVQDAAGIEAALGGAAYAGELLALRSALSEKELELLELQQAHFALAGKGEEARVKLHRALGARGDAARGMEGAVRSRDEARAAADAATEKVGKMRVELRAAREGAAAVREESAAYRVRLESEQRRVTAAERTTAKATTDASNARHERDAVRRDVTLGAAALARRLEEERDAAALEAAALTRRLELRDAAAIEAAALTRRVEGEREVARRERDTATAAAAALMAERDGALAHVNRVEGERDVARGERDTATAAAAALMVERDGVLAHVNRLEGEREVAPGERDTVAALRAERDAALAHVRKLTQHKSKEREESHSRSDKAGRGEAQAETAARRQADDVRVDEARAEAGRARAEAREHARAATQAAAATRAVVAAQATLEARLGHVLERVNDTQKHAASRAAAASRHKEAARDLRRRLTVVHATLVEAQAIAAKKSIEAHLLRKAGDELRTMLSTFRAQPPPPAPTVDAEAVNVVATETAAAVAAAVAAVRVAAAADTSAREVAAAATAGAVEEATFVLTSALKQCSESRGVEFSLLRHLATTAGRIGSENRSGGGEASALLTVAHRAAQSLATATSQAAAAEDTASNLHLELAAVQAERQAVHAAAERESEVARGWEDAAARAESAWMDSQKQLHAARAAGEKERARAESAWMDSQKQLHAARAAGEKERKTLESTAHWLSDSDLQNAKLDEVIQRLATRSLGTIDGGKECEDDEAVGARAGDARVGGASSSIREGLRPRRYRAEVAPPAYYRDHVS
jgi:hypothetical protein